jgi:hypothetical protein
MSSVRPNFDNDSGNAAGLCGAATISSNSTRDKAAKLTNLSPPRPPNGTPDYPSRQVSSPLFSTKKAFMTAFVSALTILIMMLPTLSQTPKLFATGGTEGIFAQLLVMGGVTLTIIAAIVGSIAFVVVPRVEEAIRLTQAAVSSAEETAEKVAIFEGKLDSALVTLTDEFKRYTSSIRVLRTGLAEVAWQISRAERPPQVQQEKQNNTIAHLAHAFHSHTGCVDTLNPMWVTEVGRTEETGGVRFWMLSEDIAPSFARLRIESIVAGWRVLFHKDQTVAMAIFLWALDWSDRKEYSQTGCHLDVSKLSIYVDFGEHRGLQDGTIVVIPRVGKTNDPYIEVLKYASPRLCGDTPPLQRFTEGSEYTSALDDVRHLSARSVRVSPGALRKWLGDGNIDRDGFLSGTAARPAGFPRLPEQETLDGGLGDDLNMRS